MAQWVKALVDKPDGLIDLSDALDKKNQLRQVVLWLLYTCHNIQINKYT